MKHLLGMKEKKKAKVGCMWHPSFPKIQPCFDFLKFQLQLPNTKLQKVTFNSQDLIINSPF